MTQFLSAFLIACCVATAAPKQFSFQVRQPSEVTATILMDSPGSDWSIAGQEAALAVITLDGAKQQHMMLFAGPVEYGYKIFLGSLAAGPHTLSIDRDAQYSAPKSQLHVRAADFHETPPSDPEYAVLANTPVVFARKNTIGKFTDIPLIVYCEKLREGGEDLLQYTMIFSNEDGGTSTRALMARWGRTTDIEYLYRGFLDASGRVVKATMQARNHQELPFTGQRDGGHPLLIPVTDNNMVAGDETSPIRYQIAPLLIDLSSHSREEVMDRIPISYQVMAKELVREGKLRPFGSLDGEKISDPRNYAYFEYQAHNNNGAIAMLIKRKGDSRWQSSSLGRLDYAIGRNGWVRTTVELPPGTKASDIDQIGVECLVTGQPPAQTGECHLDAVSKMFLLDPKTGLPGSPVWHLETTVEIPSGKLVTFAVSQK